VGDHFDAFKTIVDVHETSRLITVTPDFYLMVPGKLCFDQLPADGRGGFFPSAGVGAVRAINVMEPGQAGGDAEIFPEMPAHPLAEELFPTVTVFGHRRVGIGFPERNDFRIPLFIRVIYTGGGSEEETFHPVSLGGQE
jgi:hypothetical protein